MNAERSYPIIDAHVHVIERLAGYGARGEMRSLGDGMARWANGDTFRILPEGIGDSFSPDALIAIMDRHQVSQAILMQGSYYGFCNDYTHDAQLKYPGRLFGMGTFDPYSKMAGAIMENLINHYNFRGFKFEMSEAFGFMGYHPEFKLNASVMDRVWAMAQDQKLVISLDLGTFGEPSLQIDELASLAKQLHGVQFVVEHIFFPHRDHYSEVQQALVKLESCQNISFTVASIPTSTLPECFPYPSAKKYIQIAKDILGARRLVWGSDMPSVLAGTPYDQLIQYVQTDLFTEAELKMLFHDNAARIYQI